MVQKNFEDEPWLKEIWENGNMMGRISEPQEYRGAVLFMLSDASSFMTGSHLVLDGGKFASEKSSEMCNLTHIFVGYTAW